MPNEESYLDVSLRKIAKGAGIGFTGTFIGTALGYFSRMIIARFLGASDYGLISLGFAAMSIAAALSLVGYSTGIQRYISFYKGKGDEGRIKGTIFSTLKICFPLSLIFTLLIFFYADWISIHIFHSPELTPVLRIFTIGVPFWVLATIFNSGSVGFQEIKYQVYTTFIFKDTFKLIAIVTFLVLGYEVIGASVGWVLGIIGMSFLAFYFLEKKVFPILNTKVKAISVDKELFFFSFPLIFAGLAGLITGWTDTLMLGYFRTPSEVGIYNVAMPTASLLGIVLSAFGIIFMPVVTELYARSRIEDLRNAYSSVTKWIFAVVLPGFLLMSLFSTSLIRIMFGAEYIEGATALSILAFSYFVAALVGLGASLLATYGRTKIVMGCSFVGAGSNVLFNFLLIPIYGINGAAIATGSSVVMMSILYLFFVYRIARMQPFREGYVKPLFASVIAVSVVYAITKYVVGVSLFSLATMFFVFLFLYFFLLLIFKSFEEDDLMIMRAIDQRLGTRSDWVREIIKRFS
jgi:O-antigen/teichoic acid export membrane protein